MRDRLRQPIVAATHVPHRRESTLECVTQHAYCVRGAICRTVSFRAHVGNVACIGVYVRIDETRHQSSSGHINYAGVTRRDFSICDLADQAALNEYLHAFRAFGGGAIEDARVREDRLFP